MARSGAPRSGESARIAVAPVASSRLPPREACRTSEDNVLRDLGAPKKAAAIFVAGVAWLAQEADGPTQLAQASARGLMKFLPA